MEVKDISFKIKVYHSLDELSAKDQALINQAKQATQGAYAPYSNFFVGAAAKLKDGTIVLGSNQENAAFPSGTCAERTAIFAAQANFPTQGVETLAIAACTAEGFIKQPISPCGACRQVLIESEKKAEHPMRILLFGTQAIYELTTAQHLLPLTFTGEDIPA